MKKGLQNTLLITGVLLLAAILVSGWIFFDRFVNSGVPYGTRNIYQEATMAKAMEQPLSFVGSDECAPCHQATEQEWLHSSHNSVTCEDCHGPRYLHISEGATNPVDFSVELCLGCHAELAARPVSFPQVDPDQHSGGLDCIQCHNPMHPNIGDVATEASELVENEPEPVEDNTGKADTGESTEASETVSSHPAVTDGNCLVCHQASSLKPYPADHASRTNESCVLCHSGKEQQ